eukprot:scaffold10861_cov180-Amphora_coffeaeformis.AAC.5
MSVIVECLELRQRWCWLGGPIFSLDICKRSTPRRSILPDIFGQIAIDFKSVLPRRNRMDCIRAWIIRPMRCEFHVGVCRGFRFKCFAIFGYEFLVRAYAEFSGFCTVLLWSTCGYCSNEKETYNRPDRKR